MKLPPWSDTDQGAISLALSKITDDLPERINREVEWFANIIQQLSQGLSQGDNPSECPVLPKSKEGFTSTCSPAAYQERMAIEKRKALEEEASSCSFLPIDSEIGRINRLLDSPSIRTSLSSCEGQLDKMKKLQSMLKQAQDGNLYAWQKDGPKKTYMKFNGGDRTAGVLFSLQQNR
jgi:hypothetical protein